MARLMAVVFCILGISSLCFANNKKASWANLNALQPGEKIQVVETRSKKVSGRFVSFSDTAVTVHVASSEQVIPKEDVQSVKLISNRHLFRNGVLCVVVGTAAGVGIGAAAGSNKTIGGRGLTAAVGGVLGLVGGTIVGMAWPASHKTIYQSPSNRLARNIQRK